MNRMLRPSAKAVALRDGRLLVTRNRSESDPDGEWLLLPGGGQHPWEDLHTTLRREVAEETGLLVEPGRLLWIREYIPDHHEFARFSSHEHAIEFMFETEVTAAGSASEGDQFQVGWDWVPISDLEERRFFPRSLIPPLMSYADTGESGPVYLGDVN